MCLATDVARGKELVQIPVEGLAEEQLEHLAETFHTYVSDSVINHEPIASTSTVADRFFGRPEASDDDEEPWTCDCHNSGRTTLCTVGDGDACDCVGQFGNFYTEPTSDGPQFLRLEAVSERLPLVECSHFCQCGEACANRVSQRGVELPFIVRPGSLGVGLGLFYHPKKPDALPKGAFVCLYAGEYLTTSEARMRWQSHAGHAAGEGNYILSMTCPGGTIHIDPRHIGNIGRFLNHSCDPNCVIHLISWGGGGGLPRAAVFTKRDVKQGEELTFDYGNASGSVRIQKRRSTSLEDSAQKRTKCLCGAASCRGWMPFDETL